MLSAQLKQGGRTLGMVKNPQLYKKSHFRLQLCISGPSFLNKAASVQTVCTVFLCYVYSIVLRQFLAGQKD